MDTHIRYRRELNQVIDLSKPAAEIGVAEGYFSADILAWGVSMLYMVDKWEHIPNISGDGNNDQEWHDKNLAEATERVSKYGAKVKILKGDSVEMAKKVRKKLGYVNIDCDHSYEGVRDDIEAWWPKLASGGVMSFHDYENPSYGVKRAVKEFAEREGLEIHLLPEDKMEDAGAYLIKP